jgi:hypothetical protein
MGLAGGAVTRENGRATAKSTPETQAAAKAEVEGDMGEVLNALVQEQGGKPSADGEAVRHGMSGVGACQG